ncbi:MAG TPA: LysR family transcriptional regulator [Burkholderiaceae bacterium]|nr:LysR family transcriptional regulator [Burkholderiaceae bacterium]
METSVRRHSASDLEALKRHDLNLLIVLHCLLETTSVSEAARRLGSTQPSVSRMLDRLRDSLGDPLLVKSSNRMLLTSRAERLRPLLAELIDMLESVYRPADSYLLERETRFCVIGANDAMQAIFAAPVIARMRERAPLAKVVFKPVPYPNPMRALPERQVDLLLAISKFDEPGYRVETLIESDFSCLCAIDNRHVEDQVDIATLATLPYLDISHMGVISAITEEIFAAAGVAKRPVAAMSSFLAASEVIAGSDMVSLVPSYLNRRLSRHGGVRVVPLNAKASRHSIRMIWHNATHFDPFLADVRSIVREVTAN